MESVKTHDKLLQQEEQPEIGKKTRLCKYFSFRTINKLIKYYK